MGFGGRRALGDGEDHNCDNNYKTASSWSSPITMGEDLCFWSYFYYWSSPITMGEDLCF